MKKAGSRRQESEVRKGILIFLANIKKCYVAINKLAV